MTSPAGNPETRITDPHEANAIGWSRYQLDNFLHIAEERGIALLPAQVLGTDRDAQAAEVAAAAEYAKSSAATAAAAAAVRQEQRAATVQAEEETLRPRVEGWRQVPAFHTVATRIALGPDVIANFQGNGLPGQPNIYEAAQLLNQAPEGVDPSDVNEAAVFTRQGDTVRAEYATRGPRGIIGMEMVMPASAAGAIEPAVLSEAGLLSGYMASVSRGLGQKVPEELQATFRGAEPDHQAWGESSVMLVRSSAPAGGPTHVLLPNAQQPQA
jgi:hypothetical protein